MQRTKQPSALLSRMLAAKPPNDAPPAPGPAGMFARARALHQAGKLQEAQQAYQALLALQPDHAEAMTWLGTLLFQRKQLEAAEQTLRLSLLLDNKQPIAHSHLGIVLQSLKRLAEALASYDRAIELDPGLAAAHSNRGAALRALDRYDAALASYDRALALDPGHADAQYNRGVALEFLNRHDEALAGFDRALAIRPDYVDALWNKCLAQLRLGNYTEGWRGYEWRWIATSAKEHARNFHQPLWLGDQPVAGKTILLHAEQGLGDVLQVFRYVPLLEAMGARVVLEVPASLIAVLASRETGASFVAKGQPLPPFDLHCPVMSLPLAFNTTLETIPAGVPYLFADPARQAVWRQRLGARNKPRIGLAWSGSTIHKNDHNRSIALSMLAQLITPDVDWHSLQKEVRPADQQYLAASGIQAHGEQLTDFAETAALVAELDLVISVDTSVAHLAGAMGKPLWVLLPFVADFRWLLERRDSPWYPSARLFRQPAMGDWDSVIAEVDAALASFGRT